MDTSSSRTTERLAARIARPAHAPQEARNPGDPRHALLRRARVLRPWRFALLLYAIALTTATHWPRLQLAPEVPTSDKMIHMLAFGALTLLGWRSGLFAASRHAAGANDGAASPLGPRGSSALIVTGVVALLWAALDEISQGIPILSRTVSWHDMLANACGVISAIALIWALRPLQPADQLLAPNRARARVLEFTFDEMFATRTPWIIAAMLLAACAIVIAAGRWLLPSPHSVGVFGLIVMLVAAHGLYLIYRRMFFTRFHRVLRDKPCLDCGMEAASDERSEEDAGRAGRAHADCLRCGGDRSVWSRPLPPRPPLRAVVEASIAPALVALIGIVLLFAMVLLVPLAYEWIIGTPSGRSAGPRVAQMLGRLPRELNSVVDLTIYLLLLSLVTRMWRRRMAAYIDRGFRCRRCGHDLHGTPVNQYGEGHCGECGEAFVRARPNMQNTQSADPAAS